ncbi:MAG: hypothetical protein KGI19_09610 [Thaumarchaeota archaeon]|nr:hypothetical protein [Nitrososphaerota archaeon]
MIPENQMSGVACGHMMSDFWAVCILILIITSHASGGMNSSVSVLMGETG